MVSTTSKIILRYYSISVPQITKKKMTNKDLFKQAIAEAKTIREAAITNAKEALEESLTPHLKEMLAQKLQEMEEDDMNEIDEPINGTESEEGTAGGDHGNIVKEAEEEEEEETPAEEEKEEGEEEEELEIEDMSVEDLKNLIRDIVAQEVGHDESEEELSGEETPEGEEDMIGTDSEEIDINELLAELEGMTEDDGYGKVKEVPGKGTHSYSLKPGAESGDKKGPNDGYMEEGELNEMGPEYIEGAKQLVEIFPFLTMSSASLVIGALGAVGLTTFSVVVSKVMDMALAGKFGGTAKSFAEKLQKAGGIAARVTQNREGVEAVNEEVDNMDENIDIIYQLIDAFPFLTNQTAQLLVGTLGAVGLTGLSAIMAKVHEMAKNGVFGEKGKQIGDKLSDIGNAAAGARNVSEESEELNEALKAVKILRNQLQEVNLLNAKLLYVNKVFKSTNLSEGQKVNVIAAFDKAETVREVKLVFETVSKNVVAKKPTTMKEHTSFASKATGITAAPQKEVINEVSEQVLRMQKLAGIIK
jgi:hypothetical protein